MKSVVVRLRGFPAGLIDRAFYAGYRPERSKARFNALSLRLLTEWLGAALPQKSILLVTSFVFSSCDFVDRSFCSEK